MAKAILAKLFEHNNWANREVIRACAALRDDQLDAAPQPDKWSIRENLVHLVKWQREYLSFFSRPPEAKGKAAPSFAELEESADSSGEGLLAVALAWKEEQAQFETSDGYRIDPWVVVVQALNHGAEHRKQIAHLMRLLELDPPRMDGWGFGEATGTVQRIE